MKTVLQALFKFSDLVGDENTEKRFSTITIIVLITVTNLPSASLRPNSSRKSYSGKRSGVGYSGAYKLRDICIWLYQFITKKRTKYFGVGTQNYMFFSPEELNFSQKIFQPKDFAGNCFFHMENSEQRRRKGCVEMEENLPLIVIGGHKAQ